MSDKSPWLSHPEIWKNSVAWFTYLRGCLRKAWSNSPVKHNLIKKKRYQIPNPNPKGKKATVFGFDCELCGGTYVLSEGQVDHINPAGSLRKTSDIQGFVERLLYVTEDDLRLICKGCNSALSHADKMGLSFEESVREKKAIALQKDKKDLQWLKDRGIVPQSSQAKRRLQIIEVLKNE